MPPDLADLVPSAKRQAEMIVSDALDRALAEGVDALSVDEWVDVLGLIEHIAPGGNTGWLVRHVAKRAGLDLDAPLVIQPYNFERDGWRFADDGGIVKQPTWSDPAARNDALIRRVLRRAPDWYDQVFTPQTFADIEADGTPAHVMWTGPKDAKGYGVVSLPTSVVQRPDGGAVVVKAHRVWSVAHRGGVSRDPDSEHGYWRLLDHRCELESCVAGWHVEEATVAENNRRARAKLRGR